MGVDGFIAQAWGLGEIKNNTFMGTVNVKGDNEGGIIGFYKSTYKYTSAENSIYYDNSGAEKGIGAVTYIDTNYPNPTPGILNDKTMPAENAFMGKLSSSTLKDFIGRIMKTMKLSWARILT